MLKRISVTVAIVALFLIYCPVKADACILLYAGGDTTGDGVNMFMRCEEIEADFNKLYYVSPAGRHIKGETYHGCTDFTWTFTHDSYRYTARCDGMLDGVCPGCGGTHDHTPFEEAGTNDHGVTVSAAQSLNANESIQALDPFTENGIDESVMATVLLSEAATAREGVMLLAGIYGSVGAGYEGSGVMICDQNEQWYMENLSGHEYIALRLPAGVAFMQFNVSVLGRIDLDDRENVIASEHLISLAKAAGTFVGDEKENVIDFRASFNDYRMEIVNEDWTEEWRDLVRERLVTALCDLEGTDSWAVETVLKDNDFVMTNIDEDGKIAPLHNGLVLRDKLSMENAMALFKVYPIGHEDNVNTHMYRFYPGEEKALGTEEWFAMDNCIYSVYVPVYPMLLCDTWEGCKVQLDETEITDEKPDHGDYYINDGEYHIHPDGWDKSYIGTFSALSNLLTYGELNDLDIATAEYNLQRLQREFISRFDTLSSQIKAEPLTAVREEIMTRADMEMAEQAHDLALALYRLCTSGEKSDMIHEMSEVSKNGSESENTLSGQQLE